MYIATAYNLWVIWRETGTFPFKLLLFRAQDYLDNMHFHLLVSETRLRPMKPSRRNHAVFLTPFTKNTSRIRWTARIIFVNNFQKCYTNTLALWLNSALVPPTKYLERIPRKRDFPLRAVFNQRDLGRAWDIKHDPIHTSNNAFEKLDCEGLHASSTSRAQLASEADNPETKSNLHICATSNALLC